MPELKISIITVAFNAQNTIERCLNSVLRQSYRNVQYIVIDGGSTDCTAQIISKYRQDIDIFVSEADNGVYDAMNKGIAMATGDIVGTINADDFYANDDVLANIAKVFDEHNTEILYGDLDYIDPNDKVIRKWRSGRYKKGMFNWGWMPPHPTFYCKKKLFEHLGVYKLDYGSAGDYELMLRFIHLNGISVHYLDKVLVKMVVGGISNKNIDNRVQAIRFDLKAMRNNNIFLPMVTILFKPLRKLAQFF